MEVYPVVVGDLKGSMDRTVFYKVEDRCFGRKKNQPKEREFSNEEQEHHLKFGFVGRLAGRVRYVLRECLWNKPKHLTLPNYFVRLNFGNCMVEDLESGLVTFNYEDAVFTKGSMSLPVVTVSYSEEDSSFTFALTPMAGREFPGKNASDEVHAILLESNLLQAYQLELGTRGEENSVIEALEPGWNKDFVHVYAYACNRKEKDTSDTLYLPFE